MLPDLEQLINGVEVKRPNSENEFGLNHNDNNVLINEEAVNRSGDYIYSNESISNKLFGDTKVTNSREYKLQDVEKRLAEEQSGIEQLFNGLVMQGLIGEMGLGMIKGFSEIFDIVKTAISGDPMGSYANPLTEVLEKAQEDLRQNFAIYREDPTKAFDFTNPIAYIASNIPSMLSTVSLLVPTTGIAKGLSYIPKGVKALSKVGKAGKAANVVSKETNAIYNTLNWINKTAKKDIIKNTGLVANKIEKYGDAAGKAVISRTIENFQEVREVYNNQYNTILETLSLMNEEQLAEFYELNPEYKDKEKFKTFEDIAKDVAGTASNETFKKDYAMLLLDFMQFKAMSKVLSGRFDDVINATTKQASVQSAKALTKEGSKQFKDYLNKSTTFNKLWNNTKYYAKNPIEVIKSIPFSEGVEEMYQGWASASSEDKINEVFDPNYTRRSIGSYLSDSHIWEQGMWGILGGKAFEMGLKGLNKIGNLIEVKRNKNLTKEQIADLKKSHADRQLDEIKEREDRFKNFISDIQQINSGVNPYEIEVDTEGKIVMENGVPVNKKIETSDTNTIESLKRQAVNKYIADLYLNAAFNGTASLLDEYIESAEFDKAFREVGALTSEEQSISEDIKNSYKTIKNAYNSTIRDIYSNIPVDNDYVAKIMVSDILNKKFMSEDANNEMNILQQSIDGIYKNQSDRDNANQLEKEKFILQAKKSINNIDLEIQKINALFENKLIGKSSRDAKIAEMNTQKIALINAIKNKQTNGLFTEEDIKNIEGLKYIVRDSNFDKSINDIYDKINEFVNTKLQSGISDKVSDENVKRYINQRVDLEIQKTIIDSQIPANAEQYKEIYDDFGITLDKMVRDRYKKARKNIEDYIRNSDDPNTALEEIITEYNLSDDLKESAKIIKYGDALFGKERTGEEDRITYNSILELASMEKRKRDKGTHVQQPGRDMSKQEQKFADEAYAEVEKQMNEQTNIPTGEETKTETADIDLTEQEVKDLTPDDSYIQKENDEKENDDNYSHLTVPTKSTKVDDSSYAELSKAEVIRNNSSFVLNNIIRNIINKYRGNNNLSDINTLGVNSPNYKQMVDDIMNEIGADVRVIDEFKNNFLIKAKIRNAFKDLKKQSGSTKYDKIIADINKELNDLSKHNIDDVMRYSVTETLLTDDELVEHFNTYIKHYFKINNYVSGKQNDKQVLNLSLLLEDIITKKVFTEAQIIDFVKKIIKYKDNNNFDYVLLDSDYIENYSSNYKELLNDIKDNIKQREDAKHKTAKISMRIDGSKGIKFNGQTVNIDAYRNIVSTILEDGSNKIVAEYDYAYDNVVRGIKYKIVDKNGNYFRLTDVNKDENGKVIYTANVFPEPSGSDIEVGYLTVVDKNSDNTSYKIRPLYYMNKVLNNSGFMWNVNRNGCIDERINKLFNGLINAIDEKDSENRELFELLENLLDYENHTNKILNWKDNKDIIEKLLKHPLIQQLNIGDINGAFGIEGYHLNIETNGELKIQEVVKDKDGNPKLNEFIGKNRENRLTAAANMVAYHINSILFHDNIYEATRGVYNADSIRESINNFIFQVYLNYAGTEATMQKIDSSENGRIETNFGGYEKQTFEKTEGSISSDELEAAFDYSKDHPIIIPSNNSKKIIMDGQTIDIPYDAVEYASSDMGILLGYKNGNINKPIIYWIPNKNMNTLHQKKANNINSEKKKLYEAVKEEIKNILKTYIDSDRSSDAYEKMANKLSELLGGHVGSGSNILSGVHIMTKADNRALLFSFGNKSVTKTDFNDLVDFALLLGGENVAYGIPNKEKGKSKFSVITDQNIDYVVNKIAENLTFNQSYDVMRPKDNSEQNNEDKYFETIETIDGSNKLKIKIGSYETEFSSYSKFLYVIGAFKVNLNINPVNGSPLTPVHRGERTASIVVDYSRFRGQSISPVKKKDIRYDKTAFTNKIKNSGDNGVKVSEVMLSTGFTAEEIAFYLGDNEFGISLVPEVVYYDETDTKSDMKFNPTTKQIYITKQGINKINSGGNKKTIEAKHTHRRADTLRMLVHENIHKQFDITGKLKNKQNVEDIIKTYMSVLDYLSDNATTDKELKSFINKYFKPVYNKTTKKIDIDATIEEYFKTNYPDKEDYNADEAKRVFAEEWITECLTQGKLMQYLSSVDYTENGKIVGVKVEGVIERDSIFKKIIDILLKIFNINLDNSKNNSIFAQQYMILVRHNQPTNSVENVTKEETIIETQTTEETEVKSEQQGDDFTDNEDDIKDDSEPEVKEEVKTEIEGDETSDDEITEYRSEYEFDDDYYDENNYNSYDYNVEDVDNTEMYSSTELLISNEELEFNNATNVDVNTTNVLPASDMKSFLEMFPNDKKQSIAKNIENGNIKYICK